MSEGPIQINEKEEVEAIKLTSVQKSIWSDSKTDLDQITKLRDDLGCQKIF